jgi:hypothetical protein
MERIELFNSLKEKDLKVQESLKKNNNLNKLKF